MNLKNRLIKMSLQLIQPYPSPSLTSSSKCESIAVFRVLGLKVLGSHFSSSVSKCSKLVLCVVDLREWGENRKRHSFMESFKLGSSHVTLTLRSCVSSST